MEAAGLTDTLNGEGPFTIFAPSNSAFGKIPPGDVDAVLADPAGALTDILTLHVVVGQRLSTTDLIDAGTIDTMAGTLTIDQFGDRVTVDAGSGPAIVVCGDIQTANATVHIIDTVLLPKLSAPRRLSVRPGHPLSQRVAGARRYSMLARTSSIGPPPAGGVTGPRSVSCSSTYQPS